MRKLHSAAFALFFLVLSSPCPAGPRGIVKNFEFANGSGTIDYEAGYVEATSVGTADVKKMANSVQAEQVARRTARHLAYEILAETVGRIQVDAKTLYQDAMATAGALKVETHAVIRGAQVVSDAFEWAHDPMTQGKAPRATTTLRLYLTGEDGLGHLLDKHVPPRGGFIDTPKPQQPPMEGIAAAMPAPAPAPREAPAAPTALAPTAPAPAAASQAELPLAVGTSTAEVAASPPPTPPAEPPAVPSLAVAPAQAEPSAVAPVAAPVAQATGPAGQTPRFDSLVIDTRSVEPGYEPALRVYIRDQGGAVVYGPGVARASIEREGRRFFRYASSVEEARASFDTQGNPLVVKAVQSSGPGEVMIAADDAKAVNEANQLESFLREARVVLVLQ